MNYNKLDDIYILNRDLDRIMKIHTSIKRYDFNYDETVKEETEYLIKNECWEAEKILNNF